MKMDDSELPALDEGLLSKIDSDALRAPGDDGHPPRILLLYGSLRGASYSRKAVEESARVLKHLGCETRIYDPTGLPLVDDEERRTP